MRTETSAGIKAGIIVSLLFMTSLLIRAIMIEGGPLNVGVFSQSFQLGNAAYPLWVFLVLGFLIVYTSCGLFGALAGFIFVIFVNKLPVRSTYIKSIAFGEVLIVFVSVVVAHWSIAQAVLPLVISPVYSVIFAYLFKRWTRTT